MLNWLVFILIAALLAGCGGGGSEDEEQANCIEQCQTVPHFTELQK